MSDTQDNPGLPGGGNAGEVAGARLKSFIERAERLAEERDAISSDIKEVLSEAKSSGFEVKIIRMLLRLRKMDVQERSEQEQLLETYRAAIGMV